MCVPPILVEVNLELGVTSLMRKILGTCSWRLIIYGGSCILRKTSSRSVSSFSEEGDGSYKPRSRTPLSESFSGDEDYHHRHRSKNPSSKGLGNIAMSMALNQISRSPFTRRIEEGRLPRRFTQPMFTMYNRRTNLMEHVSHFNQRIGVHSKNKGLMCKVFPSNLGLVAMRWFNGLGTGSIDSFKKLTWAFRSCFITCSKVP